MSFCLTADTSHEALCDDSPQLQPATSLNHHTLSLDISDDGKGIPASHRIGVGLHAMHERTSELGGTCAVKRHPSAGTLIQVSLPLPSEQESMASAASSESNAGSAEE